MCKYNTIMRTMTQFEKPLFERKLAKIDIVSRNFVMVKVLSFRTLKIFALIPIKFRQKVLYIETFESREKTGLQGF